MTGLAQKGSSGQMYIISPSISFLDNTISIAPAYSQVLNTVAAVPDQEFDLVFNYNVKQVHGLKFFGVYAYMWQEQNFTTYQNQNIQGGNNWTALFMTEYLY